MAKYQVLAHFSLNVHTIVEAEDCEEAHDIAGDRDPDLLNGDENEAWVLLTDTVNDGVFSNVEIDELEDD
jgi:hypothetical protein